MPPARVASTHRSLFSITAGLLGLAGVAAIWLPFAYSTSPAKAVTDGDLWYLAVPFLLAVPIAAAYAAHAIVVVKRRLPGSPPQVKR